MQGLYLSLLHPWCCRRWWMLKFPAFAPCSGTDLQAPDQPPSSPRQLRGATRCSCIPSLDTSSYITGVCCTPSMDKDLGEENQAGFVHFPAVMPPSPVAALGLAAGTAGASSQLVLHPCHLCIPVFLLSSSTPHFSPSAFTLSPPQPIFLSSPCSPPPLSLLPLPPYLGGDQYTGNAD